MKHFFVTLVSVFLLAGCVQEGDLLTFSTADPRFHIAVRLLPPPPGVDPAPVVAPDPVAVELEEEEEPQVACEIKANVGSSGAIYHMPGGAYYNRVKVDISQGDMWLCSEQEAIDAGFRKSER